MTSPVKPTRSSLRREIRRLSREFADQLFETLEQHGVFDALAQHNRARGDGQGDPTGEPGRIRRSDDVLEAVCRRVTRALRAEREPAAISNIAARMDTTPRDIAHPLALLVAHGEVVQTGERRGTRYALRTRRTKRPKATAASKRRSAARRR